MSWQRVVVVAVLASCASDPPCDGWIDLGEECDDGNADPLDGCDCLARPPWSPPLGEQTPEGFVVLEENGAWCWFQDERAVFVGDRLVASSISHAGDVQVSSYDLATGERDHGVLRRGFERDDHDVASLHVGADGRLTAFYTRHDGDPTMYWRVQAGGDLKTWSAEHRFEVADDITYSNPIELDDGLHLFFRGLAYNPTIASSRDGGETWTTPRQLMHAYTRSAGMRVDQRPYVKYASDGRRVHLLYTDGHPSELPTTSLFHAVYSGGTLSRSDGSAIEDPLPPPSAGTLIHDGARDGSAWIWDAAMDGEHPVAVFATIADGVHRYHYARWDGSSWRVTPLADGGRAIYAAEPFYSGGIALDPADPRIVYFASTQDPITRTSTPHFELYRAITSDGGSRWTYSAVTSHSTVDNFRPTVPPEHPTPTAVVWLQGTYHSYFDYDTRVVALLGSLDATVPPAPAHADFERVGRLDTATATLHDDRLTGADGDLVFEIANIRREATGEATGAARGPHRMHVWVHGLAPATRYIARISRALPMSDREEPTLWFAGTVDSSVESATFLGAHRPGNSRNDGDGGIDLAVTSDELGRVELVARSLSDTARTRMAGIEILARPRTVEVARFDVERHQDVETAPGFISLALASEFEAAASAGGVSIVARSDRRGYFSDGDAAMVEADALLGANELAVDVTGLTPGRSYELTVVAADLAHRFHAARWWVEAAGDEPRVVAGFHMSSGALGPSNSFTFVHAARSPELRLRATDVYWNRSTEPSVVMLSGVVVREVVL